MAVPEIVVKADRGDKMLDGGGRWMAARAVACLLCVAALFSSGARAEGSNPAVAEEGGHGSPLSGEATSERSGAVDEDSVRARATAYLEALTLNDWQGAYRMELGALNGSLTPLAFMKAMPGTGARVVRYQITDVEILAGDKAWVDARVTYQLPQLYKPYTSSLRMHWVQRDGRLYRFRPHELVPPDELPMVPKSQKVESPAQSVE